MLMCHRVRVVLLSFGLPRLLHDLSRRLFLDFLGNTTLDAPILLFGNLFAHFPVRRVAAQDVGIKKGHGDIGGSDDLSKKAKGPSDTGEE